MVKSTKKSNYTCSAIFCVIVYWIQKKASDQIGQEDSDPIISELTLVSNQRERLAEANWR